MKTLTERLRLALVAALVLAAGCGGNPSEPNQNTGTLHGKVDIYNLRDRASDHSGVKVTVDGKSYQTVSAADGKWSIPDLPPGTYTLRFTKDGYGEDRMYNYRFVGGGDDYMTDVALMVMKPTGFQFTDFGVISVDQRVRAYGSISNPDLKDLPVMVFIGLTPDVSPHVKDHVYRYEAHKFHDPPAQDTAMKTEAGDHPFQSLRREGLLPGTRVYARAYIKSKWSNSYYDPSTEIATRTDLSDVSSNVISFLVP